MRVKDNCSADDRKASWETVLGWINKNYNCIDGLAGPVSQTGEPYVIITQSGVKKEGEVLHDIHTGNESGVCMCEWAERIDEYAASKKLLGKKANLYWRAKPELKYRPKLGWIIYSRLLISDKAEAWLGRA